MFLCKDSRGRVGGGLGEDSYKKELSKHLNAKSDLHWENNRTKYFSRMIYRFHLFVLPIRH